MLCRTESRRFTHTTQGSTIKLQEPQRGSQSMKHTIANQELEGRSQPFANHPGVGSTHRDDSSAPSLGIG